MGMQVIQFSKKKQSNLRNAQLLNKHPTKGNYVFKFFSCHGSGELFCTQLSCV